MSPRPTARNYRVNRMPLTSAANHSQDGVHTYTGTINAEMVAVTPLHVGSGRGNFFTVDGHLTIPGSSLKGAIRSLFEIITYSCFPEQRGGASAGCSSEGGGYCPACQVFGGEGFMGRLFFHPSQVADNIETTTLKVPISSRAPTIQPGSGRRIFENRSPATVNKRRVEFLPAGTRLDLTIEFRSLASEELGLLLIVLGQDPAAPLYLKMGGVKAHGYGQVHIENLVVTRENAIRFEQYDAPPGDQMTADELIECIDAGKADTARFYADGHADVVRALADNTDNGGNGDDDPDPPASVRPEAQDYWQQMQDLWASRDDEGE